MFQKYCIDESQNRQPEFKVLTPPYYAVGIGRKPGIYLEWNDCNQQVLNFSYARHEKFADLKAAVIFVLTNGRIGKHTDAITYARISQEFDVFDNMIIRSKLEQSLRRGMVHRAQLQEFHEKV